MDHVARSPRTHKLIIFTDETLAIIAVEGALPKKGLSETLKIGGAVTETLSVLFSTDEVKALTNLPHHFCYKKSLLSDKKQNLSLYCLEKYFVFIIEQHADENIEQDYLRNVIHYSPGYIYLKDTNFHYIMCNVNFAKAAGLKSPADICGKTDFELPWAKTEAKIFRQGDIEALSGVMKINFEERQKQADGSTKNVLANKVPLRDARGKIIGVLGNYLDITDRIKMEKKLRTAKKAAEVASEAKSEFLRNMEHQLRTPFAGIYSMVELLASMEKDSDKKQMLELTYKSAKEFYDLLNNIIEFSRFQVDKNVILDKKINLRKIIEKAIAMEQAAAAVKKLEIILKYPKTVPDIFISDGARIERIILNLLSNAVKFTDEGHIEIKTKLAHKEDNRKFIIQIIVSDTGIGIAEDKQQLIYEKFYREYPANQNKYGGAGLGLHMVKQLIEDLSGEIEVVSEKGEGSVFTCTLPLKRPLVEGMLSL